MKCALAAIGLTRAVLPCAAEEFFFRDGDRIVMIGDSITEQHLHSTYVELWTITRFPTWNLSFRNAGIGGNGAPGGNNRFKCDVLCHNPTAMTVNFGMNDASDDLKNVERDIKDSSLLPSGLLGPVTIRTGAWVSVM